MGQESDSLPWGVGFPQPPARKPPGRLYGGGDSSCSPAGAWQIYLQHPDHATSLQPLQKPQPPPLEGLRPFTSHDLCSTSRAGEEQRSQASSTPLLLSHHQHTLSCTSSKSTLCLERPQASTPCAWRRSPGLLACLGWVLGPAGQPGACPAGVLTLTTESRRM